MKSTASEPGLRGKGKKKGTGPAVLSPLLITILATRNETLTLLP